MVRDCGVCVCVRACVYASIRVRFIIPLFFFFLKTPPKPSQSQAVRTEAQHSHQLRRCGFTVKFEFDAAYSVCSVVSSECFVSFFLFLFCFRFFFISNHLVRFFYRCLRVRCFASLIVNSILLIFFLSFRTCGKIGCIFRTRLSIEEIYHFLSVRRVELFPLFLP